MTKLPAMTARDIEAILANAGFVLVRQTGMTTDEFLGFRRERRQT